MYKTYTHPGQPQMQVEVILASQPQNKHSKPIYTIRMRYPRPIHGEIMTHRVFGRNARSSRAVPVRTMLLECTSIPYIPWHWGKNQSGMQADEECNRSVKYTVDGNDYFETREAGWLRARDAAVASATAFMDAGYHKQNPNRLLEPFSWIDTLITSTEWDNFLWLRDHKDAEPHLQDLARLVKQAIDEADIMVLDHSTGFWHLPYITKEDLEEFPISKGGLEVLLQISAARCARISYKPFDGDASYDKEIARYNMLVTSERVHASPLEHQGSPDILVGWDDENNPIWDKPHLHGNLNGYIQARKLVPNEVYTSN